MQIQSIPTKKGGFSLVELTIVVVILGVLATFAVPRFMSSVEKTKVSGAFTSLSEIQNLFERKLAMDGTYMGPSWDLQLNPWIPEGFAFSGLTSSNWETNWQLTVVRTGASSGHGRYRIVWDQDGFNKGRSSVPANLLPPGN